LAIYIMGMETFIDRLFCPWSWPFHVVISNCVRVCHAFSVSRNTGVARTWMTYS